jgi:hypothetical protein
MRHNAAGNAPPSTRLMGATLWAVAFSRLLDRPFDSIIQPARPRQPRHTTRLFSLLPEAVLTLRITRRPAPLLMMTACVSAVACMRLFGGDASLRTRGARKPHHLRLALTTRGLDHARLAGRICFVLARDSAPNLSSLCFAISRRTHIRRTTSRR